MGVSYKGNQQSDIAYLLNPGPRKEQCYRLVFSRSLTTSIIYMHNEYVVVLYVRAHICKYVGMNNRIHFAGE